jgi:hypothetical protein
LFIIFLSYGIIWFERFGSGKWVKIIIFCCF